MEAGEFINNYSDFIILGHNEPDGDCVGSQLVLRNWLTRLGKGAVAVSVGPFDRPEVAAFEDQFESYVNSRIISGSTAMIVVDCSQVDRTGVEGGTIKKLHSLVIDHHASGERYGDVRLIDHESPSTTLMVLDLMESMGYKPCKEEAELLLFGFCTDTGFFRHLDRNASRSLLSVSRLVEYGASIGSVYSRIYGGKGLNQYKLLGKLLSRAESYADGQILLSWQTLEDQQEGDRRTKSSDDLYRHLQSVCNNEVVVLIKEENNLNCSVGLRSNGKLDVGELAHSQGGGGHPRASGFKAEGSVEEVKKRIIGLLGRHYTF